MRLRLLSHLHRTCITSLPVHMNILFLNTALERQETKNQKHLFSVPESPTVRSSAVNHPTCLAKCTKLNKSIHTEQAGAAVFVLPSQTRTLLLSFRKTFLRLHSADTLHLHAHKHSAASRRWDGRMEAGTPKRIEGFLLVPLYCAVHTHTHTHAH